MVNLNSAVNSLVKADLVLTNGRIWTVDSKNPQAEAIAVWNGAILAIGTTQEIKPLEGY